MKKVALVTGASSGIGLETAVNLIKAGFMVYGAARRVDAMGTLLAWGGKTLALDVTDDESMKKCVQDVIDAEGRIDVLVNNAGFGLGGGIEDVSIEDAKSQFEVNVFGLARMAQLVLPVMRKQNSGRIINISSVAGKFSSPYLGWYHASKYSVEALSDALRIEVKPFGVDVILVEPGVIQTNWGKIAAENMRKNSGSSDYAPYADKVAAYYERSYNAENKIASKPSLISDTIVKAATSSKPKSRYLVGKFSKSITFARRILKDKTYDKLVVRIFMGK